MSSFLSEAASLASGPPPGRRVYVNRNLRFAETDWVGFDMDYTLAPYAKRELEHLSFEMTKARLVDTRGYPEEVRALPYDERLGVRGLAVDKRLGHVVKVDRHGYVGRAYHGRRPLDRAERHACYRNVKVRLHAQRYHWVDTLFALPEVALFAECVEMYESVLQTSVDYWKLFQDIRECIDECHQDGSLKKVVTAELDTYLVTDPQLPETLAKLRDAGKQLFVLTNSEWSYTETVLAHLLNDRHPRFPRWQDYFELTLVFGRKPAFFTEDIPFRRVDPQSGPTDEEATQLESGGVYEGGSTLALMRARPELHGEHVLYVGDHIYGDIIRSKKDTLWRTALILEELEEELLLQRELGPAQADLDVLDERRAALEDEVLTLARMQEARPQARSTDSARGREALDDSLESRRQELARVDEERDRLRKRVDAAYNPHWGSVFREGNELSRFGAQVEEYACIYTSRVSNLLRYAPTQYFQRPRHWMAHEKGW